MKKGNILLEYSVLIIFFVLAFLSTQKYMLRSLSGSLRALGDSFGYGRQHEEGVTFFCANADGDCLTDAHCQAGSNCIGADPATNTCGICMGCPAGQCYVDAGCPSGQVCDGGNPVTFTCGNCVVNCIPNCRVDADCLPGFHCDRNQPTDPCGYCHMSTYHNACIGTECVSVPGAGPDTCSSWHDCDPNKHMGCSGINCKRLSGAGADLCSNNVQCGGIDCCADIDCPNGLMCQGGFPNPFGDCTSGSCVCRPSGSEVGFLIGVSCSTACCSGSCTPATCPGGLPCTRTCD